MSENTERTKREQSTVVKATCRHCHLEGRNWRPCGRARLCPRNKHSCLAIPTNTNSSSSTENRRRWTTFQDRSAQKGGKKELGSSERSIGAQHQQDCRQREGGVVYALTRQKSFRPAVTGIGVCRRSIYGLQSVENQNFSARSQASRAHGSEIRHLVHKREGCSR